MNMTVKLSHGRSCSFPTNVAIISDIRVYVCVCVREERECMHMRGWWGKGRVRES